MSQPFVTSPSYSNIAFVVVVVVVVVFPSYQLDIRGPQNLVDAARSVVPKTSSSYSVRVDDRFVASKATLELSLPMPPMPAPANIAYRSMFNIQTNLLNIFG